MSHLWCLVRALSALLMLLIVQPAAAATVTLPGCSQANLEAAIDSASAGDTLVVPAGSCTWTGGVMVSKSIHIKAASKGAVTLTHNAGTDALFEFTESAAGVTEISNFRFIEGTGGEEGWGGMFIAVYGNGRPVLVHDNYFEMKNSGRRAIRWATNRGVIWSNEFYSNRQDANAIQIGHSIASSWTTPDTMGMRDTTGESNVYIEDNLFRYFPAQSLDPDSNSRVVIRYNTFDHSAMASHGADTSTDGTRHWELYNNTFSWTNHGDCDGSQTFGLPYLFYIRGGSGVIADNVIPDMNSCAWGNKAEILMTIQNLRRNAGLYACWTTYPAPRQVGLGHNGTSFVTDPVYLWGNTGGGNYGNPGLSDYSPNECGGAAPLVSQFIQAGRDFITGTQKPGYTKYHYPHPLRLGTTPSDTVAPDAPSGLRLQ